MSGIDQMPGCGKRLDCHRFPQRIVFADQRHQAVIPEWFGGDFASFRSERRESDINLAGGELLLQSRAVDCPHLEIDAGRVSTQVPDQRWQQAAMVEIVGSDLDGRLNGGRIEFLR